MIKNILIKNLLIAVLFIFSLNTVSAQITLGNSPYVENFDNIGTSLSTGFSTRFGATAANLGTDAAFAIAKTQWNTTSSGFRNSASATGLTNTADPTAQSNATNRALSVRQSGSNGDPGSAFIFQIANTTGKSDFVLSFKLQSLDDTSPRITTWQVDYGFGDNPTSFTATTATGTLTTGGNTFSNNAVNVNFGTALNNVSSKVWIRIVTLTPTTGASARPTSAIDDFSLSFTGGIATPDVTPPTISSIVPGNNSTNVSLTSPLAITFSEPIAKGTGNIILNNITDNTSVNIDVNSSQVVISGSKATISSTLVAAKNYAVNIQSTVFKDLVNNSFAGISNNTTWSFTTQSGSTPSANGTLNQTYNFNNCVAAGNSLSDGFTHISVTGTQVWSCTDFGRTFPGTGTSTDLGLQMNGYAGSAQENEDWLISPKFDLSGTANPLLSFYTRVRFAGEALKLYVSTNYDGTSNPSSATWVLLEGKFPADNSDAWTKSDNISLSAYKQSSVYVALVYNSSASAAARWSVDDFLLENSSTPAPAQINVSSGSVNFGSVISGSTTTKTFTFTPSNFTTDLTLTSSPPFTISKDGTAFTNSLSYTLAELSTIKTVSVKFVPTQNSLSYSTNLNFAYSTNSQNLVILSGNTFNYANTLEVVNWNLEWFAGTNGPTDNVKQKLNAIKIMKTLDADIYCIAEVVDTLAFKEVAEQIGTTTSEYGYFVSPFTTSASSTASGNYKNGQKLGFIYRKSVITPITTRGLLFTTSSSDPAYAAWSSGRFPFEMQANVTLNGIIKKINFIVIHAKAETSTGSYTKRKDGATLLKSFLDANEPNDNFILLGDFNDDLDQTISTQAEAGADYPSSSYKIIVDDASRYFPVTLPLSVAGKKSIVGYNDVVDHAIVSNEMKDFYISNSSDVLNNVTAAISPDNYNTVSDHYPILSRYTWSTTTSIAKDLKVNNSKLSIYPNPLKGNEITILLDEQNSANENYELTLIGLDGRLMFKNYDIISVSNQLLNNSLKYLNQGIYILNLKGKTNSYSLKLVKE
jgi:hypothetical protein